MTEIKIVSSEDKLGGEPRLEGTRVGVSHVAQYYEKGWNVEKISRELNLKPLQVIKALEYYYKNSEEIRQVIKDRKTDSKKIDSSAASPKKA